MIHRRSFCQRFGAPVNDVFSALVVTLAFRRWGPADDAFPGGVPPGNHGYRFCYPAGNMVRQGRIVEVVRPIGLTLAETLQESRWRICLKLRWRIEPVSTGCCVQLQLQYQLNFAARLKARSWNRRLSRHFGRQLMYLAKNIDALQQCEVTSESRNT